MISILVSTLVLCIAMYLIARHEAEISFPIILMICVGINVLGGVLGMFIGPLALIFTIALLALSLRKFCYLPWPKAFAVTGIYLTTNVILAIIFRSMR